MSTYLRGCEIKIFLTLNNFLIALLDFVEWGFFVLIFKGKGNLFRESSVWSI